MRKLLVTLALAGTLSIPSVVFAEASWYGSLRGGVNVGGGTDAKFFDGGSRWGIKGSAEAGEGLTAVYRFEHKISTTDGGQPGGRLAYVGLTGGFGSLTMGQIWNAAYNHPGSITDQSFYFGDSGTGYRHGNALSYAFSSGALGFQLDLVMDGGMDTGKAIDKTEFGMTIGLGEIGKVALAHTNQRDHMVTSEIFVKGTPATVTPGTPASVTPGTPASLTPGTPASLTPGTAPVFNPGAYPTNKYMNIVANLSTTQGETFNLDTDDEGNVIVAAATRWVAGGNKYKTEAVINQMHTTKINPTDGGLDGDSTADTHVDRTATPIIVESTAAVGTAPDAAQLASLFEKTDTGYRQKSCADTGATCFEQPVFVVKYRGGDTVIDQETGNLVAPERLTFALGDSAEINHEGEVQVADGITEGTPPSFTPGTDPTFNPGTPATIDPGTPATINPGTPPTIDPGTVSDMVKQTETKRGHKATHVAVQFSVGGISPYIGYSEKKMNGATAESKTTHYGMSGSLGDTGMGYLVAARSHKAANGAKSTPWLINVWRDLGGGATVIFGHGNADDGKSGQSRVGLHVGF